MHFGVPKKLQKLPKKLPTNKRTRQQVEVCVQ